MATIDTRGDSGTPPAPHYCTQRLTDDGAVTGCPDWPECLFADVAPGPVPIRPVPHSAARALGIGLMVLSAVVVLIFCAALFRLFA